jgi:hypothetical protein
VVPRTGLDDVEKGKFLLLVGLELRPSAVQPAIPARSFLQIQVKIGYISLGL